MDKNKLKLIVIVIAIGLLAAWVFGVVNNERLLWIIGVLGSSGAAFYNWLLKEEKSKELKRLKNK